MVLGGGAVVGEVLSETALPRMLADDAPASAYGLALPTSLAGIVVGWLLAGPLVAAVGLTGALTLTGRSVLLVGAVLLRRPLRVAYHPGSHHQTALQP